MRGAFEGFTYRAARVVVVPSLGAESFAFKRMHWMQADGLERWAGEELARLDVAGAIPTREAIRLGIVRPFSWSWRRSASGITDVWEDTSGYHEQVELPVDHVSAILVHGRSAAPLVLGLMGLVADVLVVRSLSKQSTSTECAGPSGPGLFTDVEHSKYDFFPATGEFGLPALAAAGPDSAGVARDR